MNGKPPENIISAVKYFKLLLKAREHCILQKGVCFRM